MARFPKHMIGHGPVNPFPGLKALERRIGREIPHRLGSNEGLDMPHQALRRHFGDAMVAHVASYGDCDAQGVRERISRQKGIALDSLLVDAGADSLIALSLRALVDPGESVVCARGTYPTFAYFAEGQGCRLVEPAYQVEPGRLAPDIDALIQAAHEQQAHLVYLANPDNPSGHLHDDATIRRLRAELPEECWLLLDEAYHDFREDADHPTASEVLPGVVRLRTLSKAHGLAGLRVGYAIADPEVLAMMQRVRIHYAVSSLALAAAEVVLDHLDEVERHIAQVKARRSALTAHFRTLGADVLPSDTNFIALVLPSAELAEQVQRDLLAQGCLVARPSHPALAHLLRITALEDALVPGRLSILEDALKRISGGSHSA